VSKSIPLQAALALALASAPAAWAAPDAEIDSIRSEIRALRDSYEARIRALEQRLKDAEDKAAQPVAPEPVVATPAAPSASISAFNPAVSVVLQGRYANLSRDPNAFAIAGFAPPPEAGPGRRGFSLGESELAMFANVDDKFAGNLIVSLSPENTVSVEEAYGVWLTAPYGLTPKFGRFFSGIGYLNEQHQHVWDFIDAPLAYDAFLGGQYGNDGVQVKWVAPIDHFFEVGAEAGNGDSFPGSPRNKNGAGSGAVYAHTGGDIGMSHNWRAGVSYLTTRAESGDAVRLGIADFVWKYAPNGNVRQTNFKLQGEYLRSDSGSGPRQSGWYLQAIYQFMPTWRVGVRYDQLDPGSVSSFTPKRQSVMIDYSPSEFSRWRLQLAQSRLMPDVTDNQVFVQYILSLGAHGAHRY
jgi:hypothetical protein